MPFTGSALDFTIARDTQTAGTVAALTWKVYCPTDIQVQSFTTDIRAAGDYTLTIDGVTFATVNGVAAATNGVVFTPASPVVLTAGTHTFSLSAASGAVLWYNRGNLGSTPASGWAGTGSDYLGWELCQDPGVSSFVAGSLSFKVEDSTLLSALFPNQTSGGGFAAQTWTVTFDTAVEMTGMLKRVRDSDTTGYVFTIDGNTIASYVKDSGNIYVDAPFIPASPVALSAGSHTFKVTPSANRRWPYRNGTTTTPSGNGASHTTAWGQWSEATGNQPGAQIFFRLPQANEISFTAQLPKPTVAVSLDVDQSADLSIAAELPKPTVTVSLTAAQPQLSIAATLPKPTVAVLLTMATPLTIAATLPKPTVSVSLTGFNDSDITIAATLPKPTVAVSLTAEVLTDTVSVAATLPKPTVTVALEAEIILEADTSNLDDGIWLGDAPLSEIVWEPDVVPPPVVIGPQIERDVRVSAQTIDTPPANFGLATFTPGSGQLEYATAMRPRLLIGDEDWSFYNDVPAVIDNLHFIDPLKYGSGQVTLPGINPQYPPAALGDLDAYFKTKRVRIQLVIDGDPATIANPDYYKGFVTRVDTSGTALSLMLGGEAAGRLSAYGPVPPMVYRRRQHIDHILRATFLDARVRYHKADPDDSPVLIRRGGADAAALVQEHIAIWAAATETALTVTPGDDGIYRKTVKDTETIAATAYLDSSLITQSLAQDFMEQYNSVYVRGETPRGELIANIKTPGLTQGPPLDFPLASGVLEDGMTNADTTTGAGVTTLQQALAIHDFFDWEDGVAGTFESTLEAAVRAFQRFARLTVTGTVDEQTWNRLFRLDRIGYSLDDAREYPTASDPRLDRYLRTANGSKYAANPDFDGHVLPVGLWIDGGRMTKRAAEKLAVSKLAPEGGVWVGQLTLRSGLIRGDHTPGDPITSADVMDRREVEENMLVKVPWFAGSGADGIVFHISGKDDGPEETTLLVSTRPTPTMETFAAMERLQEAKSNIGRLWSGGVRQSQVRQDQTTSWDTSSGWIARDRNLPGGEWTEIVVPAGQSGIVRRIDVETEDAVEAAFVLSQEPLGLARLNTIDPLANTGDDIWTEDEDIDAWFRRRGVIKAWGWWQQPGGYSPGKKSSGGSPTGKTRERAGIDYTTGRDPVLYLYAYVPTSTVLLAGRILRNHRTTDY